MARKSSSPSRLERWFGERMSARRARRLARAPASAWQKATPAQLERMGVSRKSEQYVPVGTKRFSANTPRLSKRQYQEKQTGISLERRAKEYASGARMYPIQAQREQAAKTRATAELKRITKKLDRLDEAINYSPKNAGTRWQVTREVREQFLEDRAAKLRGADIPDGRWHSMMDIARGLGDPKLNALMASPAVLPRSPEDLSEAA